MLLLSAVALFPYTWVVALIFDFELEEPPQLIEEPIWLNTNKAVPGAGTMEIPDHLVYADSTHRDTLPDNLICVYDKMEATFRSMSPSSIMPYCSYWELDEVFMAVLFDNPDIFWVDNYISLPSPYGGFAFFPIYNDRSYEHVSDQHARYIAEIERVAMELSYVDGLRVPNETEMAKQAMKEVSKRLSYWEHAPQRQTIKAFFGEDKGSTVCTGYAKSFKLLCSAAGLECYCVLGGTSRGEDGGHVWNMLRLDGQVAYLDITWADYGREADTYYLMTDGNKFAYDHNVQTRYRQAPIVVQGINESKEMLMSIVSDR